MYASVCTPMYNGMDRSEDNFQKLAGKYGDSELE